MAEYVRFTSPESIYGQKHILHSEFCLITAAKKIQAYRKLRQEELTLRIALKKRINELLDDLKLLDKLLPQDKLAGLEETKKGKSQKDKGPLSLEQELEIIRRRLFQLG